MDKKVYDVLKMQMDRAEKIVNSGTEMIGKSEDFNSEAKMLLEQSEGKIVDNIEFLKNNGINIDDKLKFARERAHIEQVSMFKETDNEKEVFINTNTTYDELVEMAHSRGYFDIEVEDLLSEEEICIADERFLAIEKEFKNKTKLSKSDIIFLVTAVSLQVVRQYVIDPIVKEHRSKASSNDEKNHKNKGPGWYRVPTEDILKNTVPFDTIKYGENETVKNFLKGMKNHRDVTLGHDPILGWFFGTANIMTGTITNYRFSSAHVKYVPGKGNVIHSKADTVKIFTTILDRVTKEGMDGKLALAYALIREFEHLKSDIGTAHSLPFPVINEISPEFGAKLIEYGIDAASIGTEASLAILINMLISMIHRIIMPKGEDEKIYAVKTKKILLISNIIATTSNVIAVAIAAAIGVSEENPSLVKKSINYLDVGGLLVTITRLFTDICFITKIKEEFVNSKLDEQLLEMLNSLDKYLV